MRAIRYVENNPNKAGFVLDPKRWRWGSARRKDDYGRLAEFIPRAAMFKQPTSVLT